MYTQTHIHTHRQKYTHTHTCTHRDADENQLMKGRFSHGRRCVKSLLESVDWVLVCVCIQYTLYSECSMMAHLYRSTIYQLQTFRVLTTPNNRAQRTHWCCSGRMRRWAKDADLRCIMRWTIQMSIQGLTNRRLD